MSKVSEISRQYHTALSASQEQYQALYTERLDASESFYKAFFHKLICPFGEEFTNDRIRERLQDRIQRVFNTDKLSFIAIDGTCQREIFSDLVTFFGAAYGARGEIDLTGNGHHIQYKRWSLDQDVSMVAWVPIPFARLEEVRQNKEDFLVTEEERINLSSVHVQIMQLAEVFLAYNTIRSSRMDAPHILMMDLSPSSVLASVAQRQDGIGLVGYPYDRRALTKADITVALSHPFSQVFGIPSAKKMDLYRLLVAQLHANPNGAIDCNRLAKKWKIAESSLVRAADFLVKRGVLLQSPDGHAPAIDVTESWAYTRDFFQNICERLFLKKDPGALQYDAPDELGIIRKRWMAPDDIGFLIGVGMRLLIEECWERKVLYYGIVKDSSSRYLTRNYLGVALETGIYPELQTLDIAPLPWTDRMFCELLPQIDENLNAPWSTIEFDSAFMTLHREVDQRGETKVAGVMGRIVNQENLFAKSLGQFYINRQKHTPLMGHVVFLERLLTPLWDMPGTDTGPFPLPIYTPELGKLSVITWKDKEKENLGQRIMMYLLSVLVRNHYAEAIGYPDPLHKADWGAKTIGRTVGNTIRSSTRLLASKPLSRTFRNIRDSRKR